MRHPDIHSPEMMRRAEWEEAAKQRYQDRMRPESVIDYPAKEKEGTTDETDKAHA